MRREIDGPVIAAFEKYVEPNLPADAPADTNVQILCAFKLGDLLSLRRARQHMDNVTKPVLNLAAESLTDAKIQHHEFMGGDATCEDDTP